MPPVSHVVCSTNWNSAVEPSKSAHSTRERTSTINVVTNATSRAKSSARSHPGAEQNEKRAYGGQEGDDREDGPGHRSRSLTGWTVEKEPRHQPAYAKQHDEGVVIDVARLQPDRAPRRVEHARGNPIRPEPVDDADIALLP